MKVLTVVGNRPQFIKAAPLALALREAGIEEVSLHTGQHYDRELSQVFYEELALQPPSYSLDTRSADPELMRPGLLDVLAAERPDVTLVFGDTNSTLAGAQAAVAAGVPVAHVEAGLRSGDLSMPEERNRIEVDRIANLLLCPDERSRELLEAEGVPGRIEVVGDVMADASRLFAPLARERVRLEHEPRSYVVATIHREANVVQPRLGRLVEGLNRLADPVVFPAHPRTRAALEREHLTLAPARRARRPARLLRARGARLAGARHPHGLRRPAEGGLLVRRSVRDDAALDGVDRHRRRRRERSRRRRPGRSRPGGRGRPHAGRPSRALRRRARVRANRGDARR